VTPAADFPAVEFSDRLARLRAVMRASSVDAMLIDDCEALAYFTGYDTTLNLYRACIVPRDTGPTMVLRALDVAPFRARAWFDRCVAFEDHEDPVEKVAATLKRDGFGAAAIGFDSGSHALTVDCLERLRRALPEARFISMCGVPRALRLIKSPAEIGYLRTAARILDQIAGEVVDTVGTGVTPREVRALAARRLLELGTDPAHLGYVSVARDWSFLHMQPVDRALEHGDVLHFELVSRYRGYEARIMRCIAIGAAAPQLQAAARELVALQDRQLAAMKPGALARGVDAILRNGVLSAGLRNDYPNVTGYTLGYYSPVPIRSSDFTRCFRPDAEWHLEAGMVFHMYTSAKAVSISETVLVTESGAERLTKTDRRLFLKP
jgi:Xaa-Pro aminopeptidase